MSNSVFSRHTPPASKNQPVIRASYIIAAFLLAAIAASAQDRGLSVQAREITGDPSFDVGRQYAVIIGIDRYKEWTSLRNAVSEAKSVRSILSARYYIDEFIELYDGAATASAIRKLFAEDLPRRLSKEDSLFIFYAGHGYLDSSSTGFWIAADGVKDVYDQRGWIPNQQIRNYISAFKAQRVLVVADACFSGDFLNVSRGAGPKVDSAFFSKALRLQARQVLTSGASETVPDESEFGRYFITTLERNSDPILDPHSMYDRIRTNVTQTVPLLGTIPGNETGASFAFFLRPVYGTASFSVASPARVEVDGKDRGSAEPGKPLLLSDLPAGIHELRIVYAGAEERRSVLIRAGEASTEAFEWRAARSGRLTISAQADATVLVDGKPVGAVVAGKSLELPAIAEGERLVTLQYSDNQEDRRIVVHPDTANAASFSYRQESFATVSFEGFPDGAVVFSAGRELGTITGGRFIARNLVPGLRTFSVYYERWADPYQVSVDAEAPSQASTVPTQATFQGGRIIVLDVPRNVQVAVDGKTVTRGDGLRDVLDLGPYPTGAHAVSFSGDNYEPQRTETIVRPGQESRVTASMTMRPGSQSGGSTEMSSGLSSGFGGLRIRYGWGTPDTVVAELVREGAHEGIPATVDQLNMLSAGKYTLQSRLAEDYEWTFTETVVIPSGGEIAITIPYLTHSKSWQMDDLKAQLQAAEMDLYTATKARKGRVGRANFGALLGLASLGTMAYGIYDGSGAYPEYQAASSPAAAVSLRERLVIDQNYIIFGAASACVSFFIWTTRFGNNDAMENAEETLRYLEERIRMLENE